MNDTKMTMRAFHGDAQLKADLLAEVAKHREADQLIRGTYGTGNGEVFRGCSVGCSLHSLSRIQGKKYMWADHCAFEGAVGLPQILSRLQDRIFEGLPDGMFQRWPERFWAAIPVGADLRPVGLRFLVWIFGDEEIGIWRLWKSAEHQGAIREYAALKARAAEGETIGGGVWREIRAKLRAAAYAADAAADAGYAAAYDAAAAAYAADAAADAAAAAADAADAAAAAAAAYAGYAAAYDAAAAAYAADAAAYAAAAAAAAYAAGAAAAMRETCCKTQADKLVELLEAAI